MNDLISQAAGGSRGRRMDGSLDPRAAVPPARAVARRSGRRSNKKPTAAAAHAMERRCRSARRHSSVGGRERAKRESSGRKGTGPAGATVAAGWMRGGQRGQLREHVPTAKCNPVTSAVETIDPTELALVGQQQQAKVDDGPLR